MTINGAPKIGMLDLSSQVIDKSFNREPFGFNHNLNSLDIFELESLAGLAKEYRGNEGDYFVTSSAAAPDEKFRATKSVNLDLIDAFRSLDSRSIRILLKRPEKYDTQFRNLLDTLVQQITDQSPELRSDRILRLESAIFLTSASAVTPFHFDPSTVFFFQIMGEKIYHVYPPSALTEAELEQFYFRGMVDIAQVELGRRDPKEENVFRLTGGKGLHQPLNAPHWVETRGDISVSYSFFFETAAGRKTGRTRGFNYYLRRAGGQPRPPGIYPGIDMIKSEAMNVWIPCRKTLSYVKSVTVGK